MRHPYLAQLYKDFICEYYPFPCPYMMSHTEKNQMINYKLLASNDGKMGAYSINQSIKFPLSYVREMNLGTLNMVLPRG